jgi:ribonuclease HII
MNLDWYEENDISISDSVGIDEVGRGPIAGPVVAAAVWISRDLLEKMKNAGIVVRDSKKMTQIQRKKTVEWVKKQSRKLVCFSISGATVDEIDKFNILNATMLSMERAFASLEVDKKCALVDGNRKPKLDSCREIKAIVKGDSKVISISLASIIAKAYRDALMRKLALEYPNYGWDRNVGYGSQTHIQAILKYGITPHHRKTFAPIKDMHQNQSTMSLYNAY